MTKLKNHSMIRALNTSEFQHNMLMDSHEAREKKKVSHFIKYSLKKMFFKVQSSGP